MILTADTETTTWNKGSVYDKRNFLVANAWQVDGLEPQCDFDITVAFSNLFYSTELLVGFHIKFDLAWWRKCGLSLGHLKLHDCQLAEFFLENQRIPYPSLEDTAAKYGLGSKIDAVKEFWDKGINTDAIPKTILSSYGKQDVSLTYKIYLHQIEQFKQKPKLYALFHLACQDLLVLQEMEWNGQRFNEETCAKKARELDEELNSIYLSLSSVYPDIPINFNSGDQLSVFLYGGYIQTEERVPDGFFKSGARKGEIKYRKVVKQHQLPKLIEPLKNSELKKEGYYKTDEATLKKLKGRWANKYVPLLLRAAELEKLNSTYYRGLISKAKDMYWEPGEIHGQFNQCVAATGRLSSSNPNLQNFSSECLDIFISRYD